MEQTLQQNLQEFSSSNLTIAEQVRESRGCRILGNRQAYLTCESDFETALYNGQLGHYERTDATDTIYVSKRLTVTFEDNSVCNFTIRLNKLCQKDIVVQAQRFIQIFIDECDLTRAVWTLEGCDTVHFTKNTNGFKNMKNRFMNYVDYFFGIEKN